MGTYNMNFREFIDKDSKMVVRPVKVQQPEIDEYEEEYQEPVRKVVNKVPSRIVEDYEEPDDYEDDEFDEEIYEEPSYRTQRPVQKQVRPIRQPQQVHYNRPVKPVQRPGYAMPEDQFRRPLSISKNQLKETTIEGTANSLTEAIKRKVDTVFYRFGIQGLEKLDEKILDTIEELQYPESKQTRRPLKEMRRAPVRKVKKYRPLPLKDVAPIPEPMYEEPVDNYEEPMVEEPMEEIIEEPVQQPVEPVATVKKTVSSPKPAFLQQKKETKPKKFESTGDDDEDLISAAMSMDFNEAKEEPQPVISDEDMWGTVEAILEAQPQQELRHEPQTVSSFVQPPLAEQPETKTETVSEQAETTEAEDVEVVEKPKRKRKPKQKTETNEEQITNEEK